MRKRDSRGRFVRAPGREKVKIGATGIVAMLEVERAGQLPPELGDDVRVVARIKLPSPIPDEILFRERVKLMDGPLTSLWGSSLTGGTGRTAREKSFSASTFREAEGEAWEYLRQEISKLLTAVSERENALKLAEL